MKFINVTKQLIVNFKKKHKVTIKNIHLDKDIWSVFTSPMNILFSFFSFIIFSFTIVFLIVIYTPIFDIVPGYLGSKSREVLLESIVRLDSLDRVIKDWEKYESNISEIMNNRAPQSTTESKSREVDSLKKNSLGVSQIESTFRNDIEADTASIRRAKEQEMDMRINSFKLFTPLQGVITEYFSPTNDHFGVEISSPNSQEVLAVNSGVVILTTWTPNDGYIVQIQHGGNMVSTYKKLTSQVKKTGERVKSGEVIGFVGNVQADESQSSSDISPKLIFELWDSGSAIDPLNYILF